MYGVSKITCTDDVMLISYTGVKRLFLAEALNMLADAGIVVDMISQTASSGSDIHFSFTASYGNMDAVLKALKHPDGSAAPMVSGGYTKINLYGADMVESVGVAARALSALGGGRVEVAMITTSDLDISLLVRQEDADVAAGLLRDGFKV